jgi:hypothetical protein
MDACVDGPMENLSADYCLVHAVPRNTHGVGVRLKRALLTSCLVMRGVMHLAEGAAVDFGAAAHDAGGDVVLQIGSKSTEINTNENSCRFRDFIWLMGSNLWNWEIRNLDLI